MEIVNQCSKVPSGAIWHLHRSLKWINPADLKGLYCIRLLDQLPEPTDQSYVEYRYAFAESHDICGLYSAETNDTVSCITLNLGDIYRPIPRVYRWTTVPTLLITRTLAHEVAHHLAATRGYVFKRGENHEHREYEEVVANRYAFYVIERMQGRWYHRLGKWLIRDLADHHYIQGMLDWKEGKYKNAVKHFYRACRLNPDLDEAAYWYWRARQMGQSTEGHIP
jgi:tetratricopeptide (TPR) repeat protein